MGQAYSQIFEMESDTLCYDRNKSIVLCKASTGGKNRWAKKIDGINYIDTVIEDSDRYYISCEAGEIEGYLLAISKVTGATEWFIPGKAYFQILYGGSLYVIFADEQKKFYLLKVKLSDGTKIWYCRIDDDLCEYSFRPDEITLTYESGKIEKIRPLTGKIIY